MHHFELDRKIWEGQIYATLHIRLCDLVAPQVSNLRKAKLFSYIITF